MVMLRAWLSRVTVRAVISLPRRRCVCATRAGPHFAVSSFCTRPVTDYHTPGTPSYEANAEGYGLTRDTMKWFWDHYLTDPPNPRTRMPRHFELGICLAFHPLSSSPQNMTPYGMRANAMPSGCMRRASAQRC